MTLTAKTYGIAHQQSGQYTLMQVTPAMVGTQLSLGPIFPKVSGYHMNQHAAQHGKSLRQYTECWNHWLTILAIKGSAGSQKTITWSGSCRLEVETWYYRMRH